MNRDTETVDLLMLAARDAVARRLPYATWMSACIEAFQRAGGEGLPANIFSVDELQRAANKGTALDESVRGGYGK